jgi:hypothetical protein
MANNLDSQLKLRCLSGLVEGSSIRSLERQTGIHRDTIMRLGLRVGMACDMINDRYMVDLNCEKIQLDEIYSYIKKKPTWGGGQKVKVGRKIQAMTDGQGEIYTFMSLDENTRLVPNYKIGIRNTDTAVEFVADLSRRLKNKPRIYSDSYMGFTRAVDIAFGRNADYGQIVKTFSSNVDDKGKYTPPELVKLEPKIISGNPGHISTSYIERQNLTIRMHCRRLARLTNAISKKLENFKAAIALHFAYYNFVKIHSAMKTVPAVAAGVIKEPWTLMELLERAEGEWNI